MSSQQLPNGSSADRVRRELAAADRQRRAGAADLVLWRAAPLAAVLCIAVAAAGRWRGWSAGWALALLSLAAAGLTTRWLLSRRARTLSDAVAAGIDETAGLGGELRSASWFASADTAGPWTDHHLARAATRLAASDWTRLFPVAPAWRAKTVTAILVVCTLGLALVLPRHHPLLTSEVGRLHAATGSLPSASAADALLPELQKQLEALLAAAERTGGPPSGTPATADDIRRLIAALGTLRDAGKLQDLARAMSERPVPRPEDAPKAMQALADRAQKAAQKPGVAADVRDALEQVSDEMADAAKAADPSRGPASDAGPATAAKSDSKAASPAESVDEASIEAVSEADSGGGAGIVMMGDQDAAAGKGSPGLGLGGGSDTSTSGGQMAALEAALRRETVEASADDAGANVQTEARRKTEQGRAGVTYAGTAAATFDRGRTAPPPPVPEGRRAAVQSYFIRKQ